MKLNEAGDQDLGFLIGLPVTIRRDAIPYGITAIEEAFGRPVVPRGEVLSIEDGFIDGNVLSLYVGGWWWLPEALELG